jgi:hypothetical protein
VDNTNPPTNKFSKEATDQNQNNDQELSSTHPRTRNTYPQKISHLIQQSRHVGREAIQYLAYTKFDKTGKGITYKDLIKHGKTPKQAKNILHYHKNKGNLYANSPITIPQHYFCSREDAIEAATYNNRNIHPDPMGVLLLQTYLLLIILLLLLVLMLLMI